MDERRIKAYLRTFETLCASYSFDIPLARFLTQYYKENKQMGSKDRRIASTLIYSFCRIGNAAAHLRNEEQLAIALYLCNAEHSICAFLAPDLYASIDEPYEVKIQILQSRYGFEIENVFPIQEAISSAVDKADFLRSHFQQPDVFIRIHKGQEASVKASLQKQAIAYTELAPGILAFSNGIQLHNIKSIENRYEIQDYASQQTGQLFKAREHERWWDACAGSGGKSILLKQLHPDVDLVVSDIRPSILRNLDERFDKASIHSYRKKIIDLEKGALEVLETEFFDGIILDAPCSGSGTWGRTPEMLRRFTESQLQTYVDRQKQMATQVLPHLKSGKPFIYITCSVFSAENEAIVAHLESQSLKLEESRYFRGYEHRADTLFAARLIKG